MEEGGEGGSGGGWESGGGGGKGLLRFGSMHMHKGNLGAEKINHSSLVLLKNLGEKKKELPGKLDRHKNPAGKSPEKQRRHHPDKTR